MPFQCCIYHETPLKDTHHKDNNNTDKSNCKCTRKTEHKCKQSAMIILEDGWKCYSVFILFSRLISNSTFTERNNQPNRRTPSQLSSKTYVFEDNTTKPQPARPVISFCVMNIRTYCIHGVRTNRSVKGHHQITTNSADPDQTPFTAASGQSLHRLFRKYNPFPGMPTLKAPN